MPTTLHKILIHSNQVISSAILPIGQLSEDAQEARHKDIRRYREGYSRKSLRLNTIKDIFHHLLVSSDPFISSLRKLPKRKLKQLSQDVLPLLPSPEISTLQEEEELDTEPRTLEFSSGDESESDSSL